MKALGVGCGSGQLLSKMRSAWRAACSHRTSFAIWCAGLAIALPARGQTSVADEVQAAMVQARQAMQAQAWAQAELWLERALLLQPELAEAHVLWAQVLLQRGQVETARALLEALHDDPRTPAQQRQRLAAWLHQLAVGPALSGAEPPPRTPGPRPEAKSSAAENSIRRSVEINTGYSLNPLIQSSAAQVVLTLPTGDLTLPLQRTAQAGWLAGAKLGLESPGVWLLQAQLQTLQNSSQPSVRVSGLWAVHPLLMLSGHAQRLSDQTRRVQLGVQTGAVLPQPTAFEMGRLSAAVQLSAYQEPDAQRSGWSQRASLQWQARRTDTSNAAQWASVVWLERETRNQAAGPPGWNGFGALMEYKPTPQWSWLVQVIAQKDTAGYSPLLDNNNPRHLKTGTAQVEWALNGTVQNGWVLRLFQARRSANLPLFAWEDRGVALVWRHQH